MHHVDFARRVLREIDAKVANTAVQILAGTPADYAFYQKAVARRSALLEARQLITDGLSPDEAGELHAPR